MRYISIGEACHFILSSRQACSIKFWQPGNVQKDVRLAPGTRPDSHKLVRFLTSESRVGACTRACAAESTLRSPSAAIRVPILDPLQKVTSGTSNPLGSIRSCNRRGNHSSRADGEEPSAPGSSGVVRDAAPRGALPTREQRRYCLICGRGAAYRASIGCMSCKFKQIS